MADSSDAQSGTEEVRSFLSNPAYASYWLAADLIRPGLTPRKHRFQFAAQQFAKNQRAHTYKQTWIVDQFNEYNRDRSGKKLTQVNLSKFLHHEHTELPGDLLDILSEMLMGDARLASWLKDGDIANRPPFAHTPQLWELIDQVAAVTATTSFAQYTNGVGGDVTVFLGISQQTALVRRELRDNPTPMIVPSPDEIRYWAQAHLARVNPSQTPMIMDFIDFLHKNGVKGIEVWQLRPKTVESAYREAFATFPDGNLKYAVIDRIFSDENFLMALRQNAEGAWKWFAGPRRPEDLQAIIANPTEPPPTPAPSGRRRSRTSR